MKVEVKNDPSSTALHPNSEELIIESESKSTTHTPIDEAHSIIDDRLRKLIR